MKTVFVTGGHYTPAKAVIDELLKDSNLKIYYVGVIHSFEGDNAFSYEYQELKSFKNINFLALTTGRLQRKFTRWTLFSLAKIPVGFLQCIWWTLKFRPKLILSFGGYVSVPVVIIGKLFGAKVVTHEQTTSFGLANKIVQLFADKISVSFPSTLPPKSNDKWVITGNPIRKEIFHTKLNADFESLNRLKTQLKMRLIYITGGKQGSHIINEVVLTNLEKILSLSLVIIQTGDNQEYADYQKFLDRVSNFNPVLQKRIIIKKFISGGEIGGAYFISDLVIGRSGANTIFDLAALEKPAILIPIPWSSGHEQQKNAEELAKFGGAKILSQDSLNEEFMPALNEVLTNLNTFKNAARGSKTLVNLDSAAKIRDIASSYLN